VTATPSQTVGPFGHIGLSESFGNDLVPPDAPDAVRISGTVFDGAGAPVIDAVVEIWSEGAIARSETMDGGLFTFVARKPEAAPYLVLAVFARGLLKHVVTRMYFPGEADPVLEAVDPSRRNTLVAVEEPDGLRFDIRLQGDDETVFFAL
jgi:protocatechuate 3,4-dioxygenase alpha subunit